MGNRPIATFARAHAILFGRVPANPIDEAVSQRRPPEAS